MGSWHREDWERAAKINVPLWAIVAAVAAVAVTAFVFWIA
jgi:type VI protein secretion system component VasF